MRDKVICEIKGAIDENEQHELWLKVMYTKGGMSYYDYKTRPRGYVLTFKKLQTRRGNGSLEIITTFDARIDPGVLLETAKRFNKKRLEWLAEEILYPDAQTDETLSKLYAKCREQWPEAEFPEIEPGSWKHMIGLYR